MTSPLLSLWHGDCIPHRDNCFFSRIHPKKGFQLTGFYYGGEMKILRKSKLKHKIPIGVFILILIGAIAGCGEGGSSAPGIENSQDIGARQNEEIPVVLKKSLGPRKEICWKGKSRLKEIELQRDLKASFRKLECNQITRRVKAIQNQIRAQR